MTSNNSTKSMKIKKQLFPETMKKVSNPEEIEMIVEHLESLYAPNNPFFEGDISMSSLCPEIDHLNTWVKQLEQPWKANMKGYTKRNECAVNTDTYCRLVAYAMGKVKSKVTPKYYCILTKQSYHDRDTQKDEKVTVQLVNLLYGLQRFFKKHSPSSSPFSMMAQLRTRREPARKFKRLVPLVNQVRALVKHILFFRNHYSHLLHLVETKCSPTFRQQDLDELRTETRKLVSA